MGILVSQAPVRREVPHNPGEWMEFRRLPWLTLRQARRIQEKEQRQVLRELGGELLDRILKSDDDAEVERAKRRLEDMQWDLSQFDMQTLLEKGVVGWSDDAAVTADNIAQLDPVTAEWAARQVVEIVKPDSEEAAKNS